MAGLPSYVQIRCHSNGFEGSTLAITKAICPLEEVSSRVGRFEGSLGQVSFSTSDDTVLLLVLATIYQNIHLRKLRIFWATQKPYAARYRLDTVPRLMKCGMYGSSVATELRMKQTTARADSDQYIDIERPEEVVWAFGSRGDLDEAHCRRSRWRRCPLGACPHHRVELREGAFEGIEVGL